MQELLKIGSGQSKNCVVLLHGLTSSARMFRQVGEYLEKGLRNSSFLILMPTADERYVQWLGEKTNAWFGVDSEGLTGKCDVNGITDSCKQIDELVSKLKSEGKDKTLLGGFSQGGVIALSYPLLAEQQIDGVFSLSAYLPDIPRRKLGKKIPVFAAVGKEDELIPGSMFNGSVAELERLGFDVSKHEYEGLKHAITSRELDNLLTWLQGR